MSVLSALVIHHRPDVLDKVHRALEADGFQVLACRTHQQAIESLDVAGFFVPEVLLSELEPGSPEGSPSLAHLRSSPLTENIPVVVLASDEPDERRRALRLGLTHLVPPPHDPEEVILHTRAALEQRPNDRLLTGSLAQLPVTDLLQTVESSRRTGTITLRRRGRQGTLWLRGGRVIDAELDEQRGSEAALSLIDWQEGTFAADFGPVSLPDRIDGPTSYLLLEAMRRRDEIHRHAESPPHAALPDPPPTPPRRLLALHRALTLLNIAASYASEHLQPELLRRRLEQTRSEAAQHHSTLHHFTVGADGQVAVALHLDPLPDVDVLVAAVADWLRRLFTTTERALPGRFALAKLRAMTEALQDDLEGLGFYAALGFVSDPEEKQQP